MMWTGVLSIPQVPMMLSFHDHGSRPHLLHGCVHGRARDRGHGNGLSRHDDGGESWFREIHIAFSYGYAYGPYNIYTYNPPH